MDKVEETTQRERGGFDLNGGPLTKYASESADGLVKPHLWVGGPTG